MNFRTWRCKVCESSNRDFYEILHYAQGYNIQRLADWTESSGWCESVHKDTFYRHFKLHTNEEEFYQKHPELARA